MSYLHIFSPFHAVFPELQELTVESAKTLENSPTVNVATHQRIEKDKKDQKGLCARSMRYIPVTPVQYLQSTHGVHAQLIYRFYSPQVLQVMELALRRENSTVFCSASGQNARRQKCHEGSVRKEC
jgi:hypothetical protein